MPEDNFEQQARRRAEGFSLEPKPEVWQRVEAAIAPQRRRRRVLLWWLLPVCVAGGLATFVVNSKTERKNAISVVPVQDDKTTLKESDSSPGEAKKPEDAKASEKENFAPHVLTQAEAARQEKTEEGNKNIINPKLYSDNNDGKMHPADNPYTTHGNLMEEKQAFLHKEESMAPEQEAANDSSFALQKATEPIMDSMNGSAVSANLSADSLHRDIASSISTGKKEKKKNKKPWQTGILAEAGLSSWAKGLFTDVAARDAAYTAPRPDNTSNDDTTANNNQAFQKTKNGAHLAIGFAFQKELPHHFYFSGSLSYHYQQYGVEYLIKDSVAVGGPFNNNSNVIFITSDKYKTHFISLYTGIGSQLHRGKKNMLSAEAGIDNSMLLVLKQKNHFQSAQFSGNESLGAGYFYRWQPQVAFSLPFAWKIKETVRFQVSPFARFGLHDFEKNNSNKNNHLMSAGIQAVYFFK